MEEGSLTRVSKQIKNEWLLIFSIFIIASLLSFVIYSSLIKKPTQITEGTPYKNNIFAGITTEDQVKSKLGTPLKVESSGSANIYYYPTTNDFRQDKIEFSNGIVSTVKEEAVGGEKGSLNDFITKYGTEDAVLYSHEFLYSPGYFWGSKGVMVFGSKYDGGINEIWYFTPITKDEFLKNNPDFSKEEEVRIEQFTQP